MNKVALSIFTLIFLVILIPFNANSQTSTIQDYLIEANHNLEEITGLPEYFLMKNANGKNISTRFWSDKDKLIMAYGEPYGEQKPAYRYVGETMEGDDFTNPFFPHDAWAGGKLEDRNWIINPVRDPRIRIKARVNGSNYLDNKTIFLPSIQTGLKMYYGDVLIGESDSMWNKWHEYVHILQPPTKIAWGMGRMWHETSEGIWYITIPLTPTSMTIPPDLSTSLEAESFKDVKPGERITSTVTYKLNPEHPRPERAWLRLQHVVDDEEFPIKTEPLNGAPAPDEKGSIILQPGEEKTYSYVFTVQNSPSKILSRIDPVETNSDLNWDNNRDEAAVQIPAYDVKVQVKPEEISYTSINGDKTPVSFFITVTRKDNIPGKIKITGTIKGNNGTESISSTLDPGESETLDYGFPGYQGNYTVEAEAWPEGIKDIYPPDNRDKATISVYNQEFETDTGLHGEIIDGGPDYW